MQRTTKLLIRKLPWVYALLRQGSGEPVQSPSQGCRQRAACADRIVPTGGVQCMHSLVAVFLPDRTWLHHRAAVPTGRPSPA